jgi:hypothetical protein
MLSLMLDDGNISRHTALFFVRAQMAQLPTSLNLTRWAQPLTKPHVFEPVKQTCDGDHYDITMGVVKHQFHPSLPVVDVRSAPAALSPVVFCVGAVVTHTSL